VTSSRLRFESVAAKVAFERGGDINTNTTRSKRMSMGSEFKAFAMKGNVIDLAVGVIIGAAFGKIVDSLVKDMIMPVVGKIFGGLDFSNYFVLLSAPPTDYNGAMTYAELSKAGVPLFAYGNFITVAVNFIILAFIIFMMVRQVNRMKAEAPPPAPAAPPEEVTLLREIRDALKK
jgi:large conductance mechanosensitive channel